MGWDGYGLKRLKEGKGFGTQICLKPCEVVIEKSPSSPRRFGEVTP